MYSDPCGHGGWFSSARNSSSKGGKAGFFSGALLGFDNALFFLGLLPPVIFYSGYELHPQWLFRSILSNSGFAVVGTFVSADSGYCLENSLGLPFGTAGHHLRRNFNFRCTRIGPGSRVRNSRLHGLAVDPRCSHSPLANLSQMTRWASSSSRPSRSSSGIRLRRRTWRWRWLIFIVIFSGSAIVGGVCAAFTALTLRMLRADSDADEGAAATSRTLQLVTLCAAIWAPTFLAELAELLVLWRRSSRRLG